MRQSLILPMMMFGTFKRQRAKRDENGKTIKLPNGKNKMTKVKVVHSEANGDPGIYPSVNEIYVRMAKGRQRYSDPAFALFDKWQAHTQMWMQDTCWQTTDKQKVVIELTAYFPNDKRTRDTHNAFKMMMDAFTGLIYKDDEFALPRVMDFHRVKDGQKPYFQIDIYTKEEESSVLMERLAEKE